MDAAAAAERDALAPEPRVRGALHVFIVCAAGRALVRCWTAPARYPPIEAELSTAAGEQTKITRLG